MVCRLTASEHECNGTPAVVSKPERKRSLKTKQEKTASQQAARRRLIAWVARTYAEMEAVASAIRRSQLGDVLSEEEYSKLDRALSEASTYLINGLPHAHPEELLIDIEDSLLD